MWLESIISTTTISGLSNMILHSLWQGSLIAFLLGLALKVIPEKHADLRFNLSALAMFGMLVAAVVTFLYSIELPATQIVTGASSANVFTPGTLGQTANTSWAVYGVFIWLTGLIVLCIRLIAGYTSILRLSSRCTDLLGPALETVQMLKRRIRLTDKIRLVESTLIAVPMTIGYLKPLILFPMGLVTNLTPEQVEAVIAHELAHIKRADYLMNLVYSFIEIIFYYHPAIWWISAQMQHEREACCDDLAIAMTRNKKTYLATLCTLQEHRQAHRMAMSILGRDTSLIRRFSRHLQTPLKKSKTMEKLTIGSLLIIALFGFAFKGEPEHKNHNVSKHLQKEIVKIVILEDTIPNKKNTSQFKITTKMDGHRYQIEQVDGDITLFKIDGQKIDAADYPKYADVMTKLQTMPLLTPPTPPTPPSPPSPPAPPAPPAPMTDTSWPFVAPPAPPAPPAPMAPPAPPAPPAPHRNFEEMQALQLELELLQDHELVYMLENVQKQAEEKTLYNQDMLLQKQLEDEQFNHLHEINLTLARQHMDMERFERNLAEEARFFEKANKLEEQELNKIFPGFEGQVDLKVLRHE